MMLNRRQFFQRVSAAAVGLTIAAKLPTLWVPEPVRRRAACECLRRAYFDWVTRNKTFPTSIGVGQELFDAYERELARGERFGVWDDPEALRFKGTRLVALNELRGWEYLVVGHSAYLGAFDDVAC
jgi:hypothetical protein